MILKYICDHSYDDIAIIIIITKNYNKMQLMLL